MGYCVFEEPTATSESESAAEAGLARSGGTANCRSSGGKSSVSCQRKHWRARGGHKAECAAMAAAAAGMVGTSSADGDSGGAPPGTEEGKGGDGGDTSAAGGRGESGGKKKGGKKKGKKGRR